MEGEGRSHWNEKGGGHWKARGVGHWKARGGGHWKERGGGHWKERGGGHWKEREKIVRDRGDGFGSNGGGLGGRRQKYLPDGFF